MLLFVDTDLPGTTFLSQKFSADFLPLCRKIHSLVVSIVTPNTERRIIGLIVQYLRPFLDSSCLTPYNTIDILVSQQDRQVAQVRVQPPCVQLVAQVLSTPV